MLSNQATTLQVPLLCCRSWSTEVARKISVHIFERFEFLDVLLKPHWKAQIQAMAVKIILPSTLKLIKD